MKKYKILLIVLVFVSLFGGVAFGQILFSETWETGTIDSSKWDVGGSPAPVIHSGGYNSNYALDHNGDGWCHSAAHTKTWFSTENGIVAEFWLKAYECFDCPASVIYAGFTEMELTDNQFCTGENWYDQIVSVMAHSGSETINYWVVGNDYITEDYPDYDWHKYKIEINSFGYVSFYRDDQLKGTSSIPIDRNTYSATKFQVWGQAAYGAMLIDDITLSTTPCEGDFDGDGDVDGSDLASFAVDFGRTDCSTSITDSLIDEITLLKREIERLKAEKVDKKKKIETLKGK